MNVVHLMLVYWNIFHFNHVWNRINLFSYHTRSTLVCAMNSLVSPGMKQHVWQCKSWLFFCLDIFDTNLAVTRLILFKEHSPSVKFTWNNVCCSMWSCSVCLLKQVWQSLGKMNTVIVSSVHGLFENLHHTHSQAIFILHDKVPLESV